MCWPVARLPLGARPPPCRPRGPKVVSPGSVDQGDRGRQSGNRGGRSPGGKVVDGTIRTHRRARPRRVQDAATAYAHAAASTCNVRLVWAGPRRTDAGATGRLLLSVALRPAATLTGELVLDAQGDPGAKSSAFQVGTALDDRGGVDGLRVTSRRYTGPTRTPRRQVRPGAAHSLCHVYWQVERLRPPSAGTAPSSAPSSRRDRIRAWRPTRPFDGRALARTGNVIAGHRRPSSFHLVRWSLHAGTAGTERCWALPAFRSPSAPARPVLGIAVPLAVGVGHSPKSSAEQSHRRSPGVDHRPSMGLEARKRSQSRGPSCGLHVFFRAGRRACCSRRCTRPATGRPGSRSSSSPRSPSCLCQYRRGASRARSPWPDAHCWPRPAARLLVYPLRCTHSRCPMLCGGRCPGTAGVCRRARIASPRYARMARDLGNPVCDLESTAGWRSLPPLACLLVTLQLSTAHAMRLLLLMASRGRRGGAGAAAGRPERRRDALFRQRGAGPVRGDRHVRQSQSSRGVAGDDVAGASSGLLVLNPSFPSPRPRAERRSAPSEVMAKRTLLFALAVIDPGLPLLHAVARGHRDRSRWGSRAPRSCLRARAHRLRDSAARPYSRVTPVIGTHRDFDRYRSGARYRAAVAGSRGEPAAGERRFSMGHLRGDAARAAEFLPFGSGLCPPMRKSSRAFQVADVGGFIDYAHNDYLQACDGARASWRRSSSCLLFAAWFARLLRAAAWHAGRRAASRCCSSRAGLAMVPMMLHSVFDFALHMPANAMWFAALAGVMFHEGVDEGPQASTATAQEPAT